MTNRIISLKAICFAIIIFNLSLYSLKSSENEHSLIGYWHNWNYSEAPYISLDSIDERYDIIEIAFAITKSDSNMTMVFSPVKVSTNTFKTQIKTLQNKGKKVLLSIGGGNATIDLATLEDKWAFVNSLIDLIDYYGFDGIDIDIEHGNTILINDGGTIENPANQSMINLIDGIKFIMSDYRESYGRKLFLTMAPETAYIQGGQSGFNGFWGGYLPIVDALRDSLDILQVQFYNSGSMYGIDHNIYYQGTADFIVALTEASILGFDTKGGKFDGFPANKIAIGLPACDCAAGGGYTDTSTVRAAMDYLLGKGQNPGFYTLANPEGYHDLRGMMTWSINWDAVSTCGGSYEYAENYQRIFYFNDTTSFVENLSEDFIKIYPNPAKDYINVVIKPLSKAEEIKIFTISGECVSNYLIDGASHVQRIFIEHLPEAVYYIKINDSINKFIKIK